MRKALTPAQRGAKAVAALPEVIRIGAFDITIEKWTSLQGQANSKWGEFSSVEQRIRIQADMPSQFKAVDTLLHEVVHGIFWVFDMSDGLPEERIVGHIGTGLVMVHRDNPWLALWIAAHSR